MPPRQPATAPASPAWLLLVHQLPTEPTAARVKTWRRLQDIGAVALKGAVYVLPASTEAREDFEWIASEIRAMKGDALVFAADAVDPFSTDDIVAAFRHAREDDYRDLEQSARAAGGARTLRAGRSREALVRQLENRLARLDAMTYYAPPARDKAVAALDKARVAVSGGRRAPARGTAAGDRVAFRGRVWVTRPRPGVDRMSSAWLIRRFVDPRARFAFAETPPGPGRAVPFDMYGVEFSHADGGCTFETLARRFGVDEPALRTIGEIVHDLDLKESRYQRPEAPAVARLVEGLREVHADDPELLDAGMRVFEALYRSLSRSDAPAPRRRTRKRRGR